MLLFFPNVNDYHFIKKPENVVMNVQVVRASVGIVEIDSALIMTGGVMALLTVQMVEMNTVVPVRVDSTHILLTILLQLTVKWYKIKYVLGLVPVLYTGLDQENNMGGAYA